MRHLLICLPAVLLLATACAAAPLPGHEQAPSLPAPSPPVAIATSAAAIPGEPATPPPPAPPPTPASLPTATEAPQPASYVVQPGDTLSTLAKRYGTTVQALAELNGLQDPNQIHAGQILAIPERDSGPAPQPTSVSGLAPALPGTAEHVELVGHTPLGSIGWNAGLALAGACAYVGNRHTPAIAIVDIADPSRPAPVGAISFPPGAQPVELRILPERNLLVVADLAATPNLLTYDVSDCAHPVPLGSLTLARTPHEFFLWHDGDRVLAYVATFHAAPPDLLVIDLTNPAAPQEVARWSAEADGMPGVLHSLSVAPDGTRAWLAMTEGGFVVADVDLPHIAVSRDASGAVVPAQFPGAHSAVPLRDPRYVLLTAERYTCPFGGVAVADTADPAHPRIVSRLALPENRCAELPQPDAVFSAHNPLVVGDLAFVSWYAGGLQVLDVADPTAPVRVGQFVPACTGAALSSYVGTYPVQTWSYAILRDGLLYVVDIQSGLYVLRYTGPGAQTLAAIPHVEGNVTLP